MDAGLRALREPLEPCSPLWAWARESIVERAETMLGHLDGVRLGEDIEAVHDMRVGSRRLVAAMRVFGTCFPGPRYRELFREARQVTRRLGFVRDQDVLIDHYRTLRAEAKGAEALAIDYFIALQGRERERARGPMLRALGLLEASDFPGRVHRYLDGQGEAYAVGLGPTARNCAVCHQPFAAAAPDFLIDRYHTFYAFEPHVHNPEAVEELHEMRIAAKWLRYTMELFSAAYPDGLKEPLSVVKKFQELLGDLHDSDVRLDLMRQILSRALDARALQVVGRMLPDEVEAGLRRLLAREEKARRACYRAFHKEWVKQDVRGFAETSRSRLLAPIGSNPKPRVQDQESKTQDRKVVQE